jgi:hypothetical protein
MIDWRTMPQPVWLAFAEAHSRRETPSLVRPGHTGHIALGTADEQIGRYEEAGGNAIRSSNVKTLAGLAADPAAVYGWSTNFSNRIGG